MHIHREGSPSEPRSFGDNLGPQQQAVSNNNNPLGSLAPPPPVAKLVCRPRHWLQRMQEAKPQPLQKLVEREAHSSSGPTKQGEEKVRMNFSNCWMV